MISMLQEKEQIKEYLPHSIILSVILELEKDVAQKRLGICSVFVSFIFLFIFFVTAFLPSESSLKPETIVWLEMLLMPFRRFLFPSFTGQILVQKPFDVLNRFAFIFSSQVD